MNQKIRRAKELKVFVFFCSRCFPEVLHLWATYMSIKSSALATRSLFSQKKRSLYSSLYFVSGTRFWIGISPLDLPFKFSIMSLDHFWCPFMLSYFDERINYRQHHSVRDRLQNPKFFHVIIKSANHFFARGQKRA